MGRVLTVISLDDMKKALFGTLSQKGMNRESIEEIARFIMFYFGFSDHVVDNRLSAAERDLFYMLEEEGILGTYQEEVALKRGKLWRLHYWVMKKDHILKLARRFDEECDEECDEEKSVYDDPTLWERR